jgi:hypothetical protein
MTFVGGMAFVWLPGLCSLYRYKRGEPLKMASLRAQLLVLPR